MALGIMLITTTLTFSACNETEVTPNLSPSPIPKGHGMEVSPPSIPRLGYRSFPVRIMDDVATVAVGNNHTVAIRDDDSLWGWDNNGRGQLEIGPPVGWDEIIIEPRKIIDDVVAVSVGSWDDIHHRNIGGQAMAVRSDGSLWVWENNWYGQIGDGTTERRDAPTKIMDDVIAVSAANPRKTFAIKVDGSLWGWGRIDK